MEHIVMPIAWRENPPDQQRSQNHRPWICCECQAILPDDRDLRQRHLDRHDGRA